MKLTLFLVGLALAGYAGYQVEPALRITLAGKPTPPVSSSPSQHTHPSSPEIDFSTIPPEQFPGEVTLLAEAAFSDENTGLRMALEAGAKAKLVRVANNLAIIRFGSTEYITSIPVSQTDLAQRILHPSPSTAPVPEPATEPTPTPAAAISDAPPPAPNTSPTPEPATEPNPAPAPDPAFPGSDPTPAPEPQPAPAPETAPVADAPATIPPAGEDDIIAIMRQSLDKGEIKEFSANQVKSWKAEPQETVEGTTYDIGTAVYEQETVFGLKSITAKAFIRNRKVERWIWPKSGLTIQ